MDYTLTPTECNIMSTTLDPSIISTLWIRQRGLCRITRQPLSLDGGMNKGVVAPRIVHEDISDQNCILVTSVVDKMRKAVDLPWRQFVALMRSMADMPEF